LCIPLWQADPTRYPYLVHLETTLGTSGSFCGGSLVAKDVVLTASHCIEPLPTSGSVVIKRHDLTSNDGERINVKEFILHPSYNPKTFAFDYALVVLERATTQDVKLIVLNSDQNFPAAGSVARIMGWGRTTHQPGSGSDVALEADVNVISNNQCAGLTGEVIGDHTICTLRKDKFVGKGDSGKELVCALKQKATWHSPQSPFHEMGRWSTHHCWCFTRARCSSWHCIMGF
jgi:secreted trypsin-like serine protease